ncbi:MAG: hypothetical protein WD830_11245 [Chloroflexota bacterium]
MTRWLSVQRSSVYELRPMLIEESRGTILALTEDHCRVDPDWAKILMQLHIEHPEALAIGGPVANDATAGSFDRASYLVVQAGCLPPVRPGPTRRLAHANISYKRKAFGAATAIPGLGLLDSFHQTALASQPGATLLDPRPVVWHDQSLGIRGFIRQHFHAGRTWGGFVRAEGGRRRLFRLAAAPMVPWVRLTFAVAAARRSNYRNDICLSFVPMILLLLCQTAGQIVGLTAGAGDSPLRVEG